jgi:transcription initiation factor TFIIB
MMNYDDMFNELDTIERVEIAYDCCNDTNNYKISDDIILCNICNNIITNIVDTPEWRYYGNDDTKNGDPTRCGIAVNPLLPESSVGSVIRGYSNKSGMYQVKKYQQWTNMTYKERSLFKVFVEIANICNKNNIPKIIINEAKSLYKLISNIKISRGNNRIGIIAACVYFACKNCNVSRSGKEISDIFNIKINILTKGCKNFQTVLQLNKEKNRVDISNSTKYLDFIERFCNKLKIDNESSDIKKLSEQIEKLNIINDIRPDSYAAGCILYYCNINIIKVNDIQINKTDISKYSKISEVTINKCFKKLLENKELIN